MGDIDFTKYFVKMRDIVLAVVTLVTFGSAMDLQSPGGYHIDVGIPLAAKIKESEEKIHMEQGNGTKERVIGGTIAPENGHPFFAGLLIDLVNFDSQSVCGATLLSANRLATAAHCWEERSVQAWRFTVILGTRMLYFGGQRIMTSSIALHPQYNKWSLSNDVAVIYLPVSVQFSASIQPIMLPVQSDVANMFVGQLANAVGFGFTRDGQVAASTVLSHVNLRIISLQECRALASHWASSIFPNMMCTSGAGGVGVCSGDSGGPLAAQRDGRPLLLGISSFAAVGNCEDGWPSGFARVTSFINFFNQHL